MTYRERLRQLRCDKELTTQQVSDYLHMPSDMYTDFENSKVELPARYLIALSELYGVSVDYLICVTDKPERL